MSVCTRSSSAAASIAQARAPSIPATHLASKGLAASASSATSHLHLHRAFFTFAAPLRITIAATLSATLLAALADDDLGGAGGQACVC